MAADFTNAGNYADSFNTMTREEQLQYLSAASDSLRALRKQVLDSIAVEAVIDNSDRAFAVSWQANLKTDIEAGGHGQATSLDAKAQDLFNALNDIS